MATTTVSTGKLLETSTGPGCVQFTWFGGAEALQSHKEPLGPLTDTSVSGPGMVSVTWIGPGASIVPVLETVNNQMPWCPETNGPEWVLVISISMISTGKATGV